MILSMRARRRTSAALIVAIAVLALPGSASAKKVTLHASLTGALEVPPGAPNASAKATVTLDATTRRVCWRFTALKGFSRPNAAHIHQGSAGRAGNIVVPFGAAYKSDGCQTRVSKTVIKQILAHPKLYYVNIHNAAFPAGAVRGQLKR
jgi:CHRD domain